ncbi:MAG: hypothetical protein ACUVTQ_06305 [Desulfotomaculales bacterium]
MRVSGPPEELLVTLLLLAALAGRSAHRESPCSAAAHVPVILQRPRNPLPGELVRNGSFEEWQGEAPAAWKGVNVGVSSDPHSGERALRLGADPALPATVHQDVPITEACRLELRFVLRVPEVSDGPLEVRVEWLDASAKLQGTGLRFTIPGTAKPHYTFYWRCTSPSPPGTAYARITFSKPGAGRADLDDVSLINL